MITSELTIMIERPLAVVYQYLMHLANYPIWQSGLVSVAASDGLNPGSLINFVTIGMGREITMSAQVIENDGATSFRVLSTRGPISFESDYALESDRQGTILKLTNKIETNLIFKLAEPALQTISDGKYQSDLTSLKTILESTPESMLDDATSGVQNEVEINEHN